MCWEGGGWCWDVTLQADARMTILLVSPPTVRIVQPSGTSGGKKTGCGETKCVH